MVREGGGERYASFQQRSQSKGTKNISIEMTKRQNVVTAFQTKHSRGRREGQDEGFLN